MKNYLLLLMAVLNYMPVLAIAAGKTKLSGIVTDKATGQPIVGASVYIAELKSGVTTDIDGKYMIDNLPQRKVLVQAHFLGYKNVVEVVDLATVSVHNFALEAAVTEVNEVVVTGSSHATELKQNPISIATVDKSYIEQNQGTNAIDLIAKVPGVNAVTTGPNVSKPFIRGLGYNRILTLYDGNRQEGQQWGDEHGIEVDEYAIDHVEIVKGPASLTYGSDALGGVINLLPAQSAPEGHILGDIIANYQSNNRMIGTSGNLSGNQNGIIWSGRVSHKMATNYEDKYDGRVYGTAFNETDASGVVGINRSWGFSHVAFTLYDDNQEIPDGSRDSASRKFTKQITEADTVRPIVSNDVLNSYHIADLHQHVQHYRVYTSNTIFLGAGKLELNFAYQRSVRREFSHPQAINTPGLYLLLQTGNYDVKYHLPELKGVQITVGINGMYQANVNQGTEFIIPNYRLFDIGPFVHLTKTLGPVELSGGVRYDVRSFHNDAMYTATNSGTGFDGIVTGLDTVGSNKPFSTYSHVFQGFSGSVGASWAINNNFTLKANISRGFRAPNISEISANGVHPGTNIYQIGNAAFNPEFSVQEDIDLFYTSRHITASIELFNNNLSNYIYNQKLLSTSGGDSIIVPGNQTFKFQQSRAQLYGGEFFIDIHPHPLDWLHFENSLSIVYAINRGIAGQSVPDSIRNLPFIPPIHGRSEVKVEMKNRFHYFQGAYVQVGIDYYAKQNLAFTAYGTETPTNGYVLINMGIGSNITNKSGKTVFKVSLQGNNLLDEAYQSHLSRLKYFEQYTSSPTGHLGIYNMGRNISIRIEVPLDFKTRKA